MRTKIGSPATANDRQTSLNVATVANTIAETNLWSPSIWARIPATELTVGRAWTVECGGYFTTQSAPNLTLRARVGISDTPANNSDLGASPTVKLASVGTASPWYARLTVGALRTYDIGTVQVVGCGVAFMSAAPGATTTAHILFGQQSSAILGRQDQALSITATWGTARATNSITTTWVVMRNEI